MLTGVVFMVGGLAIVVGVRTVWRNRRFAARAVWVPGVVVGSVPRWERTAEQWGTISKLWQYPVVRYQRPDGSFTEQMSVLGRDGYRFKEGTRLGVLIDPGEPDRPVLEGLHIGELVTGVGFIGIGIFFALFGLSLVPMARL